jgi:AraC-like DNA-binding protein
VLALFRARKSPIVRISRIVADDRDGLMLDTVEMSDGVRIDWACRAVNFCQAAFGDALEGDPICVDVIIDHLKRRMERPASATESLYLRHVLVIVIERIGERLHERFHLRFAPEPCSARPTQLYRNIWPRPSLELTELLDSWHAEYLQWFEAHHTMPPALQAKRILHDRYAEPVNMHVLARDVGCSRTTLIEQFTRAFALSPAEYLSRVRMRHGLHRSRNSNETINGVALSAGYKSGDKFSNRVRSYTGLTAVQVRELNESDFDSLLENRLPLQGQE